MATYSEQLDSVQSAIASIEAGAESVSFNGRSVRYTSLQTLYDRERWLRKMVAKESRGGIRVRGATIANDR